MLNLINDLDWFVEWKPWLWSRPVRWVIGNPRRFVGKRVLELGCRSGRMSCYFGTLGAEVLGIDLPHCDLGPARALATRLGLTKVSFATYDGDLRSFEPGHWDFVFSKSVLVLMPTEAASADIKRLLTKDGEYLGCENLRLPGMLNLFRRYHYAGLSSGDFKTLRQNFDRVEVKKHLGLVAGIRATVNGSV